MTRVLMQKTTFERRVRRARREDPWAGLCGLSGLCVLCDWFSQVW